MLAKIMEGESHIHISIVTAMDKLDVVCNKPRQRWS